MYYPDPMQIINQTESQEQIRISLPSGGFIMAEYLDNKDLRIAGIVSTDPMDFMNENWQPGKVFSITSPYK